GDSLGRAWKIWKSRRTIRGESLPQNPRPETGAEFLTSLLGHRPTGQIVNNVPILSAPPPGDAAERIRLNGKVSIHKQRLGICPRAWYGTCERSVDPIGCPIERLRQPRLPILDARRTP
ncbi:MAG: hypothetical protein KKE66_14810, partial [Gammaproteobacteria bacterium]|nr:hypothetical protein [Gammaproteobacteria bacterium]MBU0856170.1 hypothetical protein [Gammaproteobacteria bacterium]